VDVTLMAFDTTIATYQVRLTESGRVLAEPTVSIKVGSRAVIGTQGGQRAPYAFVVLSLPAPYVQAPLTWTPRQEAPAGGRAPRLIESVRPDSPPIAQAAHVAGTVIAECIVGTDGAPRDIRIMRSIPLLDQAAIEAVKMYRFEPARDASGNPIAFRILVSIRFEPRRD
jgi:TonB family protein